MPLSTYGVDDAGYRAPRGEELLAILQDSLNSAFGTTLEYNSSTVEGVIAGILAATMADLSEGSMQALADALDVNNARGQMLENICALFGLGKSGATPSRVELAPTLSAPSAFVPMGTRFATAPSGTQTWQIWEALEDTALTGAPGEVIAAQCITPGPGPVAAGAGSITAILDSVAGLLSVTNPAPAVLGRAEQKDRELRLERLRLLQAGGKGTLQAMYAAAVAALPAGYFVGVVENQGDAGVLIDSTPVAGHGHAVVVYPAPTAAEAATLRLAILVSRPIGGATSGDQLGLVTDPETGYTTTVGFYVASAVPVLVELTLAEVEVGFDPAEVGVSAQAAVSTLFAGLRVGDDVRLLQLQRALAAVDGLLAVGIRLNPDGLGYAAADVSIGEFHTAQLAGVVIL